MSSTLVIEKAPLAVTVPLVPKKRKISYPTTDGKPMAETDKHRDEMVDKIATLRRHFADQADVYVTGNIMFYYVEGDKRKFISPDVMVVKGVPKAARRVFCLWEERPPCVVFELSSKSTRSEDFEKKFRLYEQFGVAEYYVFDPEQMNPGQAWTVFHLVNGKYQRVTLVDGQVYSPELGLEIVQAGQTLRFRDPVTQELLPTSEELEGARQQAEAARREAEAERQAEAAARREAEIQAAQKDSEIARLRAELARLRGA